MLANAKTVWHNTAAIGILGRIAMADKMGSNQARISKRGVFEQKAFLSNAAQMSTTALSQSCSAAFMVD